MSVTRRTIQPRNGAATAANVADVMVAHKLIREDDDVACGDAGYRGIEKREEIASDPHLSQVDYRIAHRPKSQEKIPKGFAREFERALERRNASVRGKVEHPFQIVKRFSATARLFIKDLRRI